jgi:hypothetical protein
MADVVEQAPAGASVVEERVLRPRPRMSWGAIIGGMVAALGIGLLLYALGVAIGLSHINPRDLRSLRSSGILTGIWALATPLIALFVGGFVAARWSTAVTRPEGATHGLVVWGLTSLAGAYLLITALSAVVGGVATVGHAVAQAGGGDDTASGASAGGDTSDQSVAIDADEALRPVNERLQAQGRPPITTADLEAAAVSAAQEAQRTGQRLDRDMLVNALAQNTGVSRADAQEIADRMEAQFDRAQNNAPGAQAPDMRATALQAVRASGKAFWGIFAALLLGLIAALVGGATGVPGAFTRRTERLPVARPVRPPVAPPREVYP